MDATPHIPFELVELLNKINNNINEVKERLARIEAQDHSDSIKTLQQEISKERDARIQLQIDLANVKTKLTPIVAGISIAAAAAVSYLIK